MAISREQAKVLSAIVDGPTSSEERARRKGVRMETIVERTKLPKDVCVAAIAFLRRKREGYIKQVPGSTKAPRWALTKDTAKILPRDRESADLLAASFELRNTRNNKVHIDALRQRFKSDYGDRVDAVVAHIAKQGYYLEPDNLPDYYTVKPSNFTYESEYVALRRR